MPSIPKLKWSEQSTDPYGQKDQAIACALCPLDEVPPATIYMYKGTSVCASHRDAVTTDAEKARMLIAGIRTDDDE